MTNATDVTNAADDTGTNSKNPPFPGEQHPCMCDHSQKYTEHAKTTIPSPGAMALPEPVEIELLEPLALVTALAPAPVKGEHPPPGLPLRLRYSIFRL